MRNHTPISYLGNKSDVAKIKTLAQSKHMSVGELVADAVWKVYGDELRIVEKSLAALDDRLNESSSNRTHKQS